MVIWEFIWSSWLSQSCNSIWGRTSNHQHLRQNIKPSASEAEHQTISIWRQNIKPSASEGRTSNHQHLKAEHQTITSNHPLLPALRHAYIGDQHKVHNSFYPAEGKTTNKVTSAQCSAEQNRSQSCPAEQTLSHCMSNTHTQDTHICNTLSYPCIHNPQHTHIHNPTPHTHTLMPHTHTHTQSHTHTHTYWYSTDNICTYTHIHPHTPTAQTTHTHTHIQHRKTMPSHSPPPPHTAQTMHTHTDTVTNHQPTCCCCRVSST